LVSRDASRRAAGKLRHVAAERKNVLRKRLSRALFFFAVLHFAFCILHSAFCILHSLGYFSFRLATTRSRYSIAFASVAGTSAVSTLRSRIRILPSQIVSRTFAPSAA